MAQERGPLKVKTHQLGPTTHVLPQSPVISALWHPLACRSTSLDCLVTITAEAAVRVWELDRNNLWSFDRPSLAIDLQKLADGTACDEDFEPWGFGKSRGFSADALEMEVSAASFGGHGLEEEDGWASMTLWTAMRNGDVYALCPLLPTKWRPASTLIPSLSTSVISKVARISDDTLSSADKQAMQQQFEWVQEIDGQEPSTSIGEDEPSFLSEVRNRPVAPSAIPRLQGPFLFDLEENEMDVDVSDIQVTAAKVNAEDLLSGEEEDYADLEGLTRDRLSATVICLATTTGKIHVCLDLEGVSGQWLPKSGKGSFTVPVGEPKDLILVESVQVASSEADSQEWPLFSPDPTAPYDFYLTSSSRVDFISLSAWASRLEEELLSVALPDSGLEFRLKVLCGDDIAFSEEILHCSDQLGYDSMEHLSRALIMCNSEIGHFLLTGTPTGPHAVTFDIPAPKCHAMILARAGGHSSPRSPSKGEPELSMSSAEAMATPARPAYEPPAALYDNRSTQVKELLLCDVPSRRQAASKQEIRLSPRTLDIMTVAHRLLSLQTTQVEQAAAELFRRCDRLREELEDQVRQMVDLSERIQRNNSATEDRKGDRNSQCEYRITKAMDRQQRLGERYETLRRKVSRATSGGKEMSIKEKAWVSEMAKLGSTFGVESAMEVDGPDFQAQNRIGERINTVSPHKTYQFSPSASIR